jgi:hypothetical protein
VTSHGETLADVEIILKQYRTVYWELWDWRPFTTHFQTLSALVEVAHV